jgi:hypothetical protein
MSGPLVDTRPEQAERLADYLDTHPEATASEMAAACDPGCVTRVLSAMVRELGYGIRKGWRWVPCAHGRKRRRVRTYTLTNRPERARQLALSLEE